MQAIRENLIGFYKTKNIKNEIKKRMYICH